VKLFLLKFTFKISVKMINLWKVREMVDKATNLVMNYTETEAKVREATNDDPWGPSGAQMQEISSFTYTYELFPEALGMLWKRMLQVKTCIHLRCSLRAAV